MAVHGLDKLIDGPAGLGGYLASLGVPAPTAVGWAVALGESAGGLLLIVGLLSRLVSFLLALHLCVAMLLVNVDTGFMTPQAGQSTGAGVEFPLVLVAALLAVALTGPGPLALDRVVGLERDPVSAEATRPAPAVAAERAVRAAVTSGAIGGVIGAVMSALVNYLAVGMPATAAANAGNHAVSGLVSGFLAGFMGLLAHLRKKPAPTGRATAHTVPAPSATPVHEA
jgi:uncharacterized membrane protein YphA (DoxX/SURF4 family)